MCFVGGWVHITERIGVSTQCAVKVKRGFGEKENNEWGKRRVRDKKK
jgi:hypothetical protein